MTGQRRETRLFIAHPACRESMDLRLTKSYLIMGAKEDVHKVGNSYQFVLGETTWIEYWPTEVEAQQPEFNSRFVELDEFAFDLINGCSH